MEKSPFLTSRPWRHLLFLLFLAALTAAAPRRAGQYERNAQKEPDALPASEFSRLIQDLSEADGYFRSDNFTSNETSYLHVIDKLRELEVSGGAYIGVGPEQNFTYIAKIRPQIAFIVDIRRQAAIQHLLYKAIFHQADTRAQFLADLLCRPLAGDKQPTHTAPISELVDYFSHVPASNDAFVRNLARVKKTVQEDFHFPLTDRDQGRLEYVYRAFRDNGLGVSFQSSSFGRSGYGGYPTLGDLALETDLQGRPGNFLASDDDYRFVRRLHELNRIVPVTGDFAGSKALASVGAYLKEKGYTVSAFYTSNVEQFLFQNGVFRDFVANVRKLPIDDKSVFIRAVARMRQTEHPAYQPGHRTVTLLQKISVFLRDQDTNLYPSYCVGLGGLTTPRGCIKKR